MKNKSKRILWLLNHKTLMPYEVPLLLRMGFEVFTPKIIPKDATFRSGAVNFCFDESLSIPEHVIKRLNEWDVYQEQWPRDIVFYINHYFEYVFIMPMALQFQETISKFRGQILLRAFGLDNSMTYEKVLKLLLGTDIFSKIDAAKDRFWFAQGYEVLVECEPPIFSSRSIFLPIGLPEDYWTKENSWKGGNGKILFVCPSLVTNPYYAKIYADFKSLFGNLPHIIVGAQDVPVEDPNVMGFVTDEELLSLYQSCSVLYYHSRELRHVHYSPIEAIIMGLPVVFYDDSLLSRISKTSVIGAVSTNDEAISLINSIISGDDDLIRELKANQLNLAYYFSNEYAQPVWEKSFLKLEINAHKKSKIGLFAEKVQYYYFAVSASAKKFIGINNATSRKIMSKAELQDEMLFRFCLDKLIYLIKPECKVLSVGGNSAFSALTGMLSAVKELVNLELPAQKTHLAEYENSDINSLLHSVIFDNSIYEALTRLEFECIILKDLPNKVANIKRLIETVGAVTGKSLILELFLSNDSKVKSSSPSSAAWCEGEMKNSICSRYELAKYLYQSGFNIVTMASDPENPYGRTLVVAEK